MLIKFQNLKGKKSGLKLNKYPTYLYQDLSYGEILAGGPGSWLVKKSIFYMHQIKKFKNGSYVEIENDF